MSAYPISGALINGSDGPANGAIVTAWMASRFDSAPAYNAAPPSGDPDVGPVTTGETFGAPGSWTLDLPTNEPYYVSVALGVVRSWRLFNVPDYPSGTSGNQGYPAGGGGSVPTQSLSYNGAGPANVMVIDGYAWDPSVGGYLFIYFPANLSGLEFDTPAHVFVNGSGVITSFFFFDSEAGVLQFYGATLDVQSVTPWGLGLLDSGDYPGNTPNGVNAVVNQLLSDNDGGLWVCSLSYDPVGPVDAVWRHIQGPYFQEFTTDGSAVAGEYAVCDATGGSFTLTLDTPPTIGDTITVIRNDDTANVVTVAAESGMVNGPTSFTAQGQVATYLWDGTNWGVPFLQGFSGGAGLVPLTLSYPLQTLDSDFTGDSSSVELTWVGHGTVFYGLDGLTVTDATNLSSIAPGTTVANYVDGFHINLSQAPNADITGDTLVFSSSTEVQAMTMPGYDPSTGGPVAFMLDPLDPLLGAGWGGTGLVSALVNGTNVIEHATIVDAQGAIHPVTSSGFLGLGNANAGVDQFQMFNGNGLVIDGVQQVMYQNVNFYNATGTPAADNASSATASTTLTTTNNYNTSSPPVVAGMLISDTSNPSALGVTVESVDPSGLFLSASSPITVTSGDAVVFTPVSLQQILMTILSSNGGPTIFGVASDFSYVGPVDENWNAGGEVGGILAGGGGDVLQPVQATGIIDAYTYMVLASGNVILNSSGSLSTSGTSGTSVNDANSYSITSPANTVTGPLSVNSANVPQPTWTFQTDYDAPEGGAAWNDQGDGFAFANGSDSLGALAGVSTVVSKGTSVISSACVFAIANFPLVSSDGWDLNISLDIVSLDGEDCANLNASGYIPPSTTSYSNTFDSSGAAWSAGPSGGTDLTVDLTTGLVASTSGKSYILTFRMTGDWD